MADHVLKVTTFPSPDGSEPAYHRADCSCGWQAGSHNRGFLERRHEAHIVSAEEADRILQMKNAAFDLHDAAVAAFMVIDAGQHPNVVAKLRAAIAKAGGEQP